jgi:hypothetical protein
MHPEPRARRSRTARRPDSLGRRPCGADRPALGSPRYGVARGDPDRDRVRPRRHHAAADHRGIAPGRNESRKSESSTTIGPRRHPRACYSGEQANTDQRRDIAFVLVGWMSFAPGAATATPKKRSAASARPATAGSPLKDTNVRMPPPSQPVVRRGAREPGTRRRAGKRLPRGNAGIGFCWTSRRANPCPRAAPIRGSSARRRSSWSERFAASPATDLAAWICSTGSKS